MKTLAFLLLFFFLSFSAFSADVTPRINPGGGPERDVATGDRSVFPDDIVVEDSTYGASFDVDHDTISGNHVVTIGPEMVVNGLVNVQGDAASIEVSSVEIVDTDRNATFFTVSTTGSASLDSGTLLVNEGLTTPTQVTGQMSISDDLGLAGDLHIHGNDFFAAGVNTVLGPTEIRDGFSASRTSGSIGLYNLGNGAFVEQGLEILTGDLDIEAADLSMNDVVVIDNSRNIDGTTLDVTGAITGASIDVSGEVEGGSVAIGATTVIDASRNGSFVNLTSTGTTNLASSSFNSTADVDFGASVNIDVSVASNREQILFNASSGGWLQAINILRTLANKDLFTDLGGTLYIRDVDSSFANRVTVASSTGDITTVGSVEIDDDIQIDGRLSVGTTSTGAKLYAVQNTASTTVLALEQNDADFAIIDIDGEYDSVAPESGNIIGVADINSITNAYIVKARLFDNGVEITPTNDGFGFLVVDYELTP